MGSSAGKHGSGMRTGDGADGRGRGLGPQSQRSTRGTPAVELRAPRDTRGGRARHAGAAHRQRPARPRDHWSRPLEPPTAAAHWSRPLEPPTGVNHWSRPLEPPTGAAHWSLPLEPPTGAARADPVPCAATARPVARCHQRRPPPQRFPGREERRRGRKDGCRWRKRGQRSIRRSSRIEARSVADPPPLHNACRAFQASVWHLKHLPPLNKARRRRPWQERPPKTAFRRDHVVMTLVARARERERERARCGRLGPAGSPLHARGRAEDYAALHALGLITLGVFWSPLPSLVHAQSLNV